MTWLPGNSYVDFSLAAGTYDLKVVWETYVNIFQTEYGLVLNGGESYVWKAYLKSTGDVPSSELATGSPSVWKEIFHWLASPAGI